MAGQTAGIRPLQQTQDLQAVAQYMREFADLFARTTNAQRQEIEALKRRITVLEGGTP